jgi:hypothetical protein
MALRKRRSRFQPLISSGVTAALATPVVNWTSEHRPFSHDWKNSSQARPSASTRT